MTTVPEVNLDTPARTVEKSHYPRGANPNSIEALKKARAQPGEARNPAGLNGRMKGRKGTGVFESLHHMFNIEFNCEADNPLDPGNPIGEVRVIDALLLSMLRRAYNEGNIDMIDKLLDRYEGTVVQRTHAEVTVSESDKNILALLEADDSSVIDNNITDAEVVEDD